MPAKWRNNTRGGLPVVIYDIDVPEPNNGYPVHGRVLQRDYWTPQAWTEAGRAFGAQGKHPLDLVSNEFVSSVFGGGDAA